MLVLNRRPGESIVIEPDLRVTVLSVTDRRVWVGISSASAFRELRVSATVLSPSEARLEIVPMSSVVFDGEQVRISTGAEGDAAETLHAGLAVDRQPGQRVDVGDELWVAVSSISKGNPTITFGGGVIGEEFSITLIRPAGSYVRLGVDAPNRRVYREELWDAVQASGTSREDTQAVLATTARPAPTEVALPDPPQLELEPAPARSSLPGTPVHQGVAANVTAGSAAG